MGGDFSILSLDHVTITTPEELEADTVAWYEQRLGLERIEKPEGTRPHGAWFRVGTSQLHVSRDEHNPLPGAHYCLGVDDFDAVVESLRAAGCHLEQAQPIPGRHRCFVMDPAGNRIELFAYDQGAADAPA